MTPADKLALAAAIPDDIFDALRDAMTVARAATLRIIGAASEPGDAYEVARLAEHIAYAEVGRICDDWLTGDDAIVPIDDEEIERLARLPANCAAANLELARSLERPALRVVKGGRR